MRVVGVETIEQANEYLTNDYLAWWERELTVEAANPDDAHRPLDQSDNLAASLSYVETRQVRPDYTLQWDGKFYRILPHAIVSGLRGANVRVEARLDGSLAVRFRERYLPIEECEAPRKSKDAAPVKAVKTPRARRGSDWNKNFDLHKSPKIWDAARASGYRRGDD